MGKPAFLYDIVIADDEGNIVQDCEEGNICVVHNEETINGIFKTYLIQKDKMAKVFKHGLYYTGDKAYKDEDGYVWFVGRDDDVIKASDFRVGPFEVESALMTHPAVVECAITGVPDEIRGQVVKATIVLSKDYKARAGEELIKELQNHVKKVTAPYKYPRVIEFVEELPKTISGKIRRVEIRENDKK